MENKRPTFKRVKFSEPLTSKDNSNVEHLQSNKNRSEINLQEITEMHSQLKDKIDKLEDTVTRQNVAIMEALASQKILTEKLLGNKKEKENMRQIFPINTADDLKEVNGKINETNRTDYTRCLTSLVRGNLNKNLTDIFSIDLIIDSNIDGVHGKLPLKRYQQVFDALLDAVRANGEQDPGKALRNAFKLTKKRHFQTVSVNKKKKLDISLVSMSN